MLFRPLRLRGDAAVTDSAAAAYDAVSERQTPGKKIITCIYPEEKFSGKTISGEPSCRGTLRRNLSCENRPLSESVFPGDL